MNLSKLPPDIIHYISSYIGKYRNRVLMTQIPKTDERYTMILKKINKTEHETEYNDFYFKVSIYIYSGDLKRCWYPNLIFSIVRIQYTTPYCTDCQYCYKVNRNEMIS